MEQSDDINKLIDEASSQTFEIGQAPLTGAEQILDKAGLGFAGDAGRHAEYEPVEASREDKESLRWIAENRPVRYELACGVLTLRSREPRVVQTKDGSFAQIQDPGFSIERAGHRHESPWTPFYDPKIPAQKRVIDVLDALIKNHPEFCNNIHVGLKKCDYDRAGQPFPSFDTADPVALIRVIREGGYDLTKCMDYELSKKPDDPELPRREDVIAALEDEYRVQRGAVIEEMEEGLKL